MFRKIKPLLYIFIIVFLMSSIIYYKMDNDLLIKELLNLPNYLKENHINYILIHINIISLLLTSSLTIFGILIFPCYFLFETISIIYSTIAFISAYKLKGLIFGVIYSILTKGVYLLLISILFKKILDIYKIMFTKKNTKEIVYRLVKNGKSILYIITIIIINDFFIYLFLNKILLKLIFLI